MADTQDHGIRTDSMANTQYDLDGSEPRNSALEKIRTAGSISISPELFEKIYLSPKTDVHGDIRRTFGNPTPIALGGFLLSLTPLSNVLLRWRGSGDLGAAETGVYYFFGGLSMILGGILEFILGNTFPSVVFTMFGSFWLSYGATLTPYFNAAIAYQPNKTSTAAISPGFGATFAFFHLYMGLLCLIFLICALRTNGVFCLIFFSLVLAFCCLAASFWHLAEGDATQALKLQHAGGGLTFVTSLAGWYLFTVQMLEAVDFPLNLPVGDLSRFVKGAKEKQRAKKENTSNGA